MSNETIELMRELMELDTKAILNNELRLMGVLGDEGRDTVYSYTGVLVKCMELAVVNLPAEVSAGIINAIFEDDEITGYVSESFLTKKIADLVPEGYGSFTVNKVDFNDISVNNALRRGYLTDTLYRIAGVNNTVARCFDIVFGK